MFGKALKVVDPLLWFVTRDDRVDFSMTTEVCASVKRNHHVVNDLKHDISVTTEVCTSVQRVKCNRQMRPKKKFQ